MTADAAPATAGSCAAVVRPAAMTHAIATAATAPATSHHERLRGVRATVFTHREYVTNRPSPHRLGTGGNGRMPKVTASAQTLVIEHSIRRARILRCNAS